MDDRSETTSPRPSQRVRLLMETERTVAETAVDRAHQRSDRITGAVMALREEPASWFYKPKDPRGAFDAGGRTTAHPGPKVLPPWLQPAGRVRGRRGASQAPVVAGPIFDPPGGPDHPGSRPSRSCPAPERRAHDC
jgi:hypothetical protein